MRSCADPKRAQAAPYLARLALLCLTELDDPRRALSLIEAAQLPAAATA
ncbi:hypothetical protein BJG93_35735 [Paraburkholderia sprentiae WSM5005]|uniref:Uncharacterized protein n=1 Tax=Paraburkholderia sprentiae WSM5005 TaxID=754502 RepID=A0A8F4QKT4_9BURK|nr:hypothetical protein [Paraburkholderia sprentiae]QXE07323.1 hypothetical protein BJG93_35735 [Paraburkholderia sprentiae WSM5005]